MAQLYSFKITGRTAASTDGTATGLIGTVSISWDSDGFIRFTDGNGKARAFRINEGQDDLAVLLKECFTGTGGIDAGSSGVQGHRVFGVPVLKQ